MDTTATKQQYRVKGALRPGGSLHYVGTRMVPASYPGTVHCDNMCVVECVRTGTSKALAIMQLLRELFFVCAKCNFTLSAAHIAGSINTIADALSRFHMQVFRQKAPMARTMADVATLPQLP